MIDNTALILHFKLQLLSHMFSRHREHLWVTFDLKKLLDDSAMVISINRPTLVHLTRLQTQSLAQAKGDLLAYFSSLLGTYSDYPTWLMYHSQEYRDLPDEDKPRAAWTGQKLWLNHAMELVIEQMHQGA